MSADVNAVAADGWTPLMRILCRDDGGEIKLDLLTAAIASGADFEKITNVCGEKKRPFDILREEAERWVDKYKHEARVSDEFCGEFERVFGRRSNAGERARSNAHLMMAARWGNAAQIKLALAEADVNAGNESGFTPLMFAAFYNKSDSIKFIIGAGADLEAKNAAGETALIVAACGGKKLISIETLIRAGANANAADNEGHTALMRLCERAGDFYLYLGNYAENVRALIDAGADINARNAEGKNALMMLTNPYRSEIRILEILVEAGADVNARDSLGRTALGFARRNRKLAIERLLVAAGARTDEAGPDENYFPDAALKLKDRGVEL
jgi:ankyrin repeat protein